jgi:hypothetical protein
MIDLPQHPNAAAVTVPQSVGDGSEGQAQGETLRQYAERLSGLQRTKPEGIRLEAHYSGCPSPIPLGETTDPGAIAALIREHV